MARDVGVLSHVSGNQEPPEASSSVGPGASHSGSFGPTGSFGPNAWLVEEMYARYVEDPLAVAPSWREFFEDYRPGPLGAPRRVIDPGLPAPTQSEPFGAQAAPVSQAPPGSLAAPGSAMQGSAAPGSAMQGSAAPGSAMQGSAAPGSAMQGSAAPGSAISAAPSTAVAEALSDATSVGVASAAPGSNPVAQPVTGSPSAGSPSAGSPSAGSPTAGTPAPPAGTPLTGPAARLAANMAASLSVPTATSVRDVPAKLLEVNRSILNDHLARSGGGKVSFTHVIAFAITRALAQHPGMRVVYIPGCVPEASGNGGGKLGSGPRSAAWEAPHVNLGVAVDVERPDGSRMLLVPTIRNADELDFRELVLAYEDLVRKVRTGKAVADDFTGTTASITNPGTVGTVHSVPRLMPGQSVIIGVGSIAYPAAYEAADSRVLARLGISKVVTLTSTYDHRVIQGAESGRFLSRVHDLLLGADGFYTEVFGSLGVPYAPVAWLPDVNTVGDPMEETRQQIAKQVHVQSLVNMYRVRGHLIAELDPLHAAPPVMHPELDPATYGLTLWDLDREFMAGDLPGRPVASLDSILRVLRDAYCRTMGVEYMHIQDPEQKRWIQEHLEGVSWGLDPDEQRHVLDRLNAAEAFERFLHTRYIGQKRFGLEGAESAIPFLDAVLDEAVSSRNVEAVIGMAHRGRLNVLANIVGKSYGEIFREFEGNLDPDSVQGSGDVKYHKGASGVFTGLSGKAIPVSLASNPSHLEAVDPVVEGMVRAKQDMLRFRAQAASTGEEVSPFRVLPVLIHGDAAFAGQGVVAETLELSSLRGYRTGGTIHLVINNQLGFTTAPEAARSSVYPTDAAKMVQSPIIHVNGDDPEACVRAARLAVAFRERFLKDVIVDMVCYRRHGHNEGDDPSYTQPRMYRIIEQKRSVRKLYTETLVRRGDITIEEAEQALDDFLAKLQRALDETRASAPPNPDHLPGRAPLPAPPMPDTGVAREELDRVHRAIRRLPEGFTLHPKLARQFEAQDQLYESGQVDWSTGEALAFGTLLREGVDIRLSGQDTRRGTFSQRHAVLVDHETDMEYLPLAGIAREQPGSAGLVPPGHFRAYDSLLSEYAALGFEYGYALEAREALVAWEAQFGDFANGGQVIIDNFLMAAEDKWGQACGLILLLPHGYEGQGPEHSSARIERFLTLAAEGPRGANCTLANVTTAAQYFHLLRAQVYLEKRYRIRRPLVVFTPKSLLRARQSRSPIGDLEQGSFQAILDDPARLDGRLDAASVTRVVLCSGKIAYEALARRDELIGAGAPSGRAAVLRMEQIHPWPLTQLANALALYPTAREVVWLQEEPENMGPWMFVHGRLHRMLGHERLLHHVSREPSGSPATGSAALHQLEQEDLLVRAFGDLAET